MKNMLDLKLITDFREKVNGNMSWCFFKYRNNNDKNQWNCICSAMDWIEVSAHYICSHDIFSLSIDQGIELYAYLSSIDIIVEAIEQLHRVIFSDSKTVFASDNDCFPDNPFGQSDRAFFKELRACFGAHPVRLDDPEEPGNRNAKRFASWPSKIGTGDFSVILYSNKVDGKNIILGVEFKQLVHFLNKYYSHLAVLKEQLDLQYSAFCEAKKEEQFECSGTPIERLMILKEESKKRLNNDYYNHTIDELIRVFQTPIVNERNLGLVQEYRNDLLQVIDEIYQNLQNMTLTDLQSFEKYPQHDLPLPDGWGYFVEKLVDSIYDIGYPVYVWLPSLKRIFQDKFIFEYNSLEELYVLVQATLHSLAKSQALVEDGD